MSSNPNNQVIFPILGGVAGASISTTVGSVGLVGAGGGIALGLPPVAGAGVITGFAISGARIALSEGDATALVALGVGASFGTIVYSTVGGVGLAGSFGAVGLGLGSMTIFGGVVGLGIYGAAKMLDRGSKESYAQVFSRMEEKISWREAYTQALLELELEAFLREDKLKREFLLLEAGSEISRITEELERRKLVKQNPNLFSFDDSTPSPSDGEGAWINVHTLKHHTSLVNSIAISPDGQTVISGSDDRTIVLWDLRTGNALYTWTQPDIVLSVAISPDGQWMAGAGVSQSISRWNLHKKSFLDTFFKIGCPGSHDGIIYAIAVSADGKTLASGSADKTIRIWKSGLSPNFDKLKRTLLGHTDTVLSVALTKDGNVLVSGSIDQTVRIWDSTIFKAPLILTGHSAPTNSVAIHPNQAIVASGSTDSTIRFWDIQTGKHLYTLKGHEGAVTSIAFSSDGKILVSGSKDGTIRFWRMSVNNDGTLDFKSLWSLPGYGPIALSANGKTLICSGDRGQLQVWRKCSFVPWPLSEAVS